jgi:hypothetical protein
MTFVVSWDQSGYTGCERGKGFHYIWNLRGSSVKEHRYVLPDNERASSLSSSAVGRRGACLLFPT